MYKLVEVWGVMCSLWPQPNLLCMVDALRSCCLSVDTRAAHLLPLLVNCWLILHERTLPHDDKRNACFICLPMLNITASETDCYPRSHCKIGIIVLPFLSVPLYNPIIFCWIFEILQQYVLLIYPSVFLFRIIISYLVCDPTLFRFSPVDNEVELLQRFFS